MKLIKGVALVSAASLLIACGSDDDENAPVVNAPATYSFDSKIDDNSSVSYTGQATRHMLIEELVALIKSDELQQVTTAQEALDKLNAVYVLGTNEDDKNFSDLVQENLYTDNQGATPVSYSLDSEGKVLAQTDYSQLSSGKNLQGKIAGKDNALSQAFIGWEVEISGDQTDDDRPDLLVQEWFEVIAELAADDDATTKYLGTDTIGTKGLDYVQLIQKFLLGAVTYSQAADDYLKATKGLLKQNSTGDKEGSKNYTALEHQWDEGFGYFGASRDYNLRTDAEVKAAQDFDTNEDGEIDYASEISYGHSVNANKRDAGSANYAATDYSKAAMDAFLAGRQLIQDNFGTDPVEGTGYHKYLVQYAQTALDNWENAIAATVVHYINDTVTALESLDSQSPESDANIAKYWSEMKGFALSLQFSAVAQISTADLKSVLDAMGEAPVTELNDVDDYIADLLAARAIMQEAYGFDADTVANW